MPIKYAVRKYRVPHGGDGLMAAAPVLPKMARILATLGPASAKEEALIDLLKAGANAFRINCSHAPMSRQADLVARIRRASARSGIVASIVMDLQGPRLRVGDLPGGSVVLKKDARVRLTEKGYRASANGSIPTNFKRLPGPLTKGSRILLDDGSMELTVLRTSRGAVECGVSVGGTLKEHKGINCPGARLDFPALTSKDLADLREGIKMGVDYAALSFVRDPQDVRRARAILRQTRSTIKLIAKIEHPLALRNIDAILAEVDGIMVARGDLAVEITPAEVPAAQKLLVRKANEAGKISIVATQMLESMISKPTPTRAEASDVANAVYDGADVVMLSAETAVGQYPVQAVGIMADIIRKAEASPFCVHITPHPVSDAQRAGFAHALAQAAADAAAYTQASAVAVYTLTGWSAQVMSKYRPGPIYALTPLKSTLRQLALYWGMTPVICPQGRSTDDMLHTGEKIMMKMGHIRKGQTLLITAGSTAEHLASNMLKIHICGSPKY